MQKHVALVHQAVAEFSARNFESVVELLYAAFESLELTSLYLSDDSYNAICDAVQILDLLMENLSVVEKNAYTIEKLTTVQKSLDGLVEVDLLTFRKQLNDIQDLFRAVQIGLNFLNSHKLDLEAENPLVSIGLIADGYILLYKWEQSERVDYIVDDFNHFFSKLHLDLERIQSALEESRNNSEVDRVKELLIEMIRHFPETKKGGFLELGDIYFEEENYRQAIDCYMKTIVMGTQKELLKPKILLACNTMARNASSSKDANRWREFLINFF